MKVRAKDHGVLYRGRLGTHFGSRASCNDSGASSLQRHANQQNAIRRGYLTEIAVLAITGAFARTPRSDHRSFAEALQYPVT